MADFSTITNSEIAAYADVESATFIKLKNNDDYFKSVMDGTHASDRIVAQAIETQSSGSGSGLTVTQFNHTKNSGSQVFGIGTLTADIDTGVPYSSVKVFAFGIQPTSAPVADTWTSELVIKPLSGANQYLRVTRTDDTASVTVNWYTAGITVS